MSGGHKSIDKATGRTVWDKDHFEKKAKETQQKEEEDMAKLDADINAILNDKKKEKIAPPPEERRNLTHRDYDLKLDKQLGKTQVITAHTPKQFQGGYWCDTCECLLKDSLAWLDHINGKKHNRLLGYRMNVDRVGANQVRDKLKSLSKGQEEVQEEEDPEEKLRAMREAEEEKKRRRAEKKRKKKEEAEGASSSKAKRTHFDEEEEEEELEELDADTAFLALADLTQLPGVPDMPDELKKGKRRERERELKKMQETVSQASQRARALDLLLRLFFPSARDSQKDSHGHGIARREKERGDEREAEKGPGLFVLSLPTVLSQIFSALVQCSTTIATVAKQGGKNEGLQRQYLDSHAALMKRIIHMVTRCENEFSKRCSTTSLAPLLAAFPSVASLLSHEKKRLVESLAEEAEAVSTLFISVRLPQQEASKISDVAASLLGFFLRLGASIEMSLASEDAHQTAASPLKVIRRLSEKSLVPILSEWISNRKTRVPPTFFRYLQKKFPEVCLALDFSEAFDYSPENLEGDEAGNKKKEKADEEEEEEGEKKDAQPPLIFVRREALSVFSELVKTRQYLYAAGRSSWETDADTFPPESLSSVAARFASSQVSSLVDGAVRCLEETVEGAKSTEFKKKDQKANYRATAVTALSRATTAAVELLPRIPPKYEATVKAAILRLRKELTEWKGKKGIKPAERCTIASALQLLSRSEVKKEEVKVKLEEGGREVEDEEGRDVADRDQDGPPSRRSPRNNSASASSSAPPSQAPKEKEKGKKKDAQGGKEGGKSQKGSKGKARAEAAVSPSTASGSLLAVHTELDSDSGEASPTGLPRPSPRGRDVH
mmetsp:Transcript_39327/g.77372  ORF Transcript_39327/g.77372 Transcript_39327/m.77372 type:complete len:836 (-) Transcript_39327:310-2817(-)